MKKIIFILSLFIFLKVPDTNAQGLQPGECAIMFTYDAAGNLTQREFFCNNTGNVIYRTTTTNEKGKTDSTKISIGNPVAEEEIIKVNALMPNPTTGKFLVRLADPLINGNVLLLDANGKVLEKRVQSGNILNFDISSKPSGMYFVRIVSAGKTFTFKVIKQ